MGSKCYDDNTNGPEFAETRTYQVTIILMSLKNEPLF